MIKLNLGCGSEKLYGFINIDHRAFCDPDAIDDVFTLERYTCDSVDEIIASHVLEHACFDRTVNVLKRWREILKPGGTLWVAVPNFEIIQEHYKKWETGLMSWDKFQSRIFGNAQIAREMYGTEEVVLGIYRYELAFHRAVFTVKLLKSAMEQAGFINCVFNETMPYRDIHPHEICARGTK